MAAQVVTSAYVDVNISNNASSFVSTKRFDKSISVSELKSKLELITGLSSQYSQIEVFSEDDKLLFKMDQDDRIIGSYHLDSGMRIHVIGKNPQGQDDFLDTSKVDKYNIPDDEYDKKSNTVRSFLKQNKLRQYDPEKVKKLEELSEQKAHEEEEALKKITLHSRCQITVPGQMARKGVVMYVGETEFKPGMWVGVEYDEPYGKHDGTFKGKTYFKCKPKYGAFVKPKCVECGDFPEDDLDDEDEM